MSITDSITSLGSTISGTVSDLAHEVSTRTPDLLHTVADAGHDVAKEAKNLGQKGVKVGRHTLESAGVVDKPARRKLPALLVIAALAALTFGALKLLRSRRGGPSGIQPVDQTTVSGHNAAVA